MGALSMHKALSSIPSMGKKLNFLCDVYFTTIERKRERVVMGINRAGGAGGRGLGAYPG